MKFIEVCSNCDTRDVKEFALSFMICVIKLEFQHKLVVFIPLTNYLIIEWES